MTNLAYWMYHAHGLDHLVCRMFGHRWESAGWRAKSCRRCHSHEMWWEL